MGDAPTKSEFSPIPQRALLHAVAILDSHESCLKRFVEALPLRCPGLVMGDWKAVPSERPCSYVDFNIASQGNRPYQYRLIFDPAGLPGALMQTVFAFEPSAECQEVIDRQKAAALLFLVDAPDGPPQNDGWPRFQKFAQTCWAWLDAGAELLCFPEGRAVLPRRVLLPLEPDELTANHSYLFVTNGVAHRGPKSVWLRTWGLGQFSLPELGAEIAYEQPEAELEQKMESLRLFFETLPASMVGQHGVLPQGGQVQAGPVVWTALEAPSGHSERGYLQARCGLQLFEGQPI